MSNEIEQAVSSTRRAAEEAEKVTAPLLKLRTFAEGISDAVSAAAPLQNLADRVTTVGSEIEDAIRAANVATFDVSALDVAPPAIDWEPIEIPNIEPPRDPVPVLEGVERKLVELIALLQQQIHDDRQRDRESRTRHRVMVALASVAAGGGIATFLVSVLG